MGENKIINSFEELINTLSENECSIELNEYSYKKTIYVEHNIFENLIKYELDFEPYLSIAKECLLQSVQIMKSVSTNRFYIGIVNLGGHRPVYEIKPIRLKEILNQYYIKKMFENYAQELDWGIDINEKYEI